MKNDGSSTSPDATCRPYSNSRKHTLSRPVESTRTPAVVIASNSGFTLAPIANDITLNRSSDGIACNSSKIVNVGDRPSFVYASLERTR